MAELGDLINSFEDFKLTFKELVEELERIRTLMTAISKNLLAISTDLGDMSDILEEIKKEEHDINTKLLRLLKAIEY